MINIIPNGTKMYCGTRFTEATVISQSKTYLFLKDGTDNYTVDGDTLLDSSGHLWFLENPGDPLYDAYKARKDLLINELVEALNVKDPNQKFQLQEALGAQVPAFLEVIRFAVACLKEPSAIEEVT